MAAIFFIMLWIFFVRKGVSLSRDRHLSFYMLIFKDKNRKNAVMLSVDIEKVTLSSDLLFFETITY
jgi:hypothetical protein